ncbi:hypothetical protein SAMN04488518_112112 [Pseudovibrio ascidiaceicola]|uniref:N-acyl amino acid synthase FeeM catalytic core domain-containing protein n=1 Tax=Pseudovibrio ascidiaceicola TaxID=285279 RepID=A0A1I4DTP0_9HYPH|nr:hypothetical protein [Pseudovibrio ascidiaceicola]SFK95426.1 hypothetical protein SAMN04488518_112112 [Pseudovibrio ascidiaceicola]
MSNTIKSKPTQNATNARRFSIHRRRVRLQNTPPENVIFKLADTPDELSQVCRLLYDSYTQVGYMKEDGSGYRFTPFYVLPSCYTLIAKQGDTVIGTTTIIIKSLEELPVEQIFSLKHIQRWNRRIAEASSLTIHPDHRSQDGALIHALLKYMFQVAREDLGVHDLVMASTPKHMVFYEALLLFRRLSEEVIDAFDYVNGTTATGAYLNFTEMHQDYAAMYKDVPDERNVFKYYMEYEFNTFRSLSTAVTTYNGNRWRPEHLNHFLHGPIQGANSITKEDFELLRRHYSSSNYDQVFARHKLSKATALIDANTTGIIRSSTGNRTPIIVRRIEEDRIHLTAERPYELLEGKELQLLRQDQQTEPVRIQSITLTGELDATVRYDPTSSPGIMAMLTNEQTTLSSKEDTLHKAPSYQEDQFTHVG